MKIHGHRVDELYRAFPWRVRVLIVVSIAFLLFLVIDFSMMLFVHDPRGDPGPLTFSGVDEYNGFDPALASSGEQVLLAYSNIMYYSSKDMKPRTAPGITIVTADKE